MTKTRTDHATNTTATEVWQDWSRIDPKRVGFPCVQGATLTYKTLQGTWETSNVYAPSDAVKKWDGVHPHNLCIGTRYSRFVYAHVKVTGREPRPVAWANGLWGIKVRITFTYHFGKDTAEGWLSFAHGGAGFDRYDAKHLVETCYENTNPEVFTSG